MPQFVNYVQPPFGGNSAALDTYSLEMAEK